jgi:hypothetical protein
MQIKLSFYQRRLTGFNFPIMELLSMVAMSTHSLAKKMMSLVSSSSRNLVQLSLFKALLALNQLLYLLFYRMIAFQIHLELEDLSILKDLLVPV